MYLQNIEQEVNFEQLMNNETIIIDSRTNQEQQLHPIQGIITIPYTQFNAKDYSTYSNKNIGIIDFGSPLAEAIANQLLENDFTEVFIIEA